MTDEPEYDPVDCPIEDCAFRDAPRAVAAHVSGTHDDLHDWDRLPHDGAREFVMAEKRAQLEAMGAEIPGGGRSDGGAASSTTGTASGAGPANPVAERAGTDSATTDSGRETEALDTDFVDDALAVTALLRRYDTTDLADLDTFRLVNLYTLVSNLKSTAERARKQVRDALLAEIQDDRSVAAEYGEINRNTRERRRLKDETAVRDALTRAGIDPVAVMSLDSGKVGEVVEAGRLDEDAVFEVQERPSIQRVSVAEDRRDELVAGLDPDLRELLEYE